jgi:hypothetical protein
MNPLNLNKAFQLHDIIGKYLPQINEEDAALEFIGTIVKNINSDHPQKYIDAIILMSGKTLNDLKNMTAEERINLFIAGLSINRIVELKAFCEIIGYSNA